MWKRSLFVQLKVFSVGVLSVIYPDRGRWGFSRAATHCGCL